MSFSSKVEGNQLNYLQIKHNWDYSYPIITIQTILINQMDFVIRAVYEGKYLPQYVPGIAAVTGLISSTAVSGVETYCFKNAIESFGQAFGLKVQKFIQNHFKKEIVDYFLLK